MMMILLLLVVVGCGNLLQTTVALRTFGTLAHGNLTNSLHVARGVKAESRWVMT